MPGSSPRGCPRTPTERDAAGVRGPALVQAVLPLRPGAVAGRRPGPAAAAGPARAGATASGRTCSTRTCSRCRTSGSIPGTPPGTWPSTASRWRWSTPDFAKEQLVLMLREWYMHPNGQLPAYEWEFGDVNPPVHAWAAWRVYKIEKKRAGPDRRVSGARLPQAAAELHLVGQPQGRRGAQRLPGRLPGAGQHRRLRPQRAAADGRAHRAGGRHELDGDVLPEPAGHRPGAGPRQPGLRGRRQQVLRALRPHRLRHERHRAEGGTAALASGTKRTASTTTSCSCPTAPRCR